MAVNDVEILLVEDNPNDEMLALQQFQQIVDDAELQPEQRAELAAQKLAAKIQKFQKQMLNQRSLYAKLFNRMRHLRRHGSHCRIQRIQRTGTAL